MRLEIFLPAALGILMANTALAADFYKSEGSSDAPSIIRIEGRIQPGDDKIFNQLALTVRSALVQLNSSGGKVVPSIEIGRTIRVKQFATVFTGKQCNSGCALIWMAGQPRKMGKHSALGFHVAYETMKDGSKVADPVTTAMVGAYLANLGLSDRTIFTLLDAGPDDLTELTTQKAATLGIAVTVVEDQTGVEYYAKAKLVSQKGGDQSKAETFANYLVAAQYGNAAAQEYLGDQYVHGGRLEKDSNAAVYWYTRAAERGDPQAYLSLATALSGSSDGLTQVEALKFALLAQNALPKGGDKTKADELVKTLKSKLTPELIESANDLVLIWELLK